MSEDSDLNLGCNVDGDGELESLELFNVKVGFEKSSSKFQRACIDSIAQETVTGSNH